MNTNLFLFLSKLEEIALLMMGMVYENQHI